jgi:hypothetical protein
VKRYDVFVSYGYGEGEPDMVESRECADGDWDRHSDVAPLLAELEALRALRDALPKCGCGKPANYIWWHAQEFLCDDCRKACDPYRYARKLPYTEPLRALAKIGDK